MKTQNKANLFHMSYYVNYITGEVIGGNDYGYHEDTYSYLIKKCINEHPIEYAAFNRYAEKIGKETGKYLNNDDFLVRLLGWSFIDLGDYKYVQTEAYFKTASDKPYSLFWSYVHSKKTHLERHPALAYDEKTDSIYEVPRDIISKEELDEHAEELSHMEWDDISDWYNGKPLTRTAKMKALKTARDENHEKEVSQEKYLEYEEERKLSQRRNTVSKTYESRIGNAMDILGKPEEYIETFGLKHGIETATPHHYKNKYKQAIKDGFTHENLSQLPNKYPQWKIAGEISQLLSSGNFDNEEPFGEELNKIFEESGILFKIDPNAHYKNINDRAVIYENNEPFDSSIVDLSSYEWYSLEDKTRVGFIRHFEHYIGIFLEEWEKDKPNGVTKLFDIDLSDISNPIMNYKILNSANIGSSHPSTDISYSTDNKESKLPLDEWLQIEEVAAFLEEAYKLHIKLIGDASSWSFTKMDAYIKNYNNLENKKKKNQEKEPETPYEWKPYWSDLISEGSNIYLFNDGAETRGYAKYLEDSLGVNVIVGDWTDEKTLLKGGYKDFDLLIFDRTDYSAILLAQKLTEVCDKSKIIVPVDSFSSNVLSHYLHKGIAIQQIKASKDLDILSKVTRFDYGEINDFQQELAKYIANRLGIEMKIVENETQEIKLPDIYDLSRSINDIRSSLYYSFKDTYEDEDEDENEDKAVDEAMYVYQLLYGVPRRTFKEMADALEKPVEILRKLSTDNASAFRLWHEVAQVREAALRGAKLEVTTDEKHSNLSLENMDTNMFKSFLTPTVVVGKYAESLDKGEILSMGAASGTIKTDISTLEEGDIFVCENLFEAQDVINKVGGVIARNGNFSDHAAVLASMRGIPVVISNTEFLFDNENITIDGETGKLYKGKLPIIGGIPKNELSKLMSELPIEDKVKVCANADTAYEVDMAINNYADGVGLVRVENMPTKTEEDFYKIAKAAKGKSVTFRITKPFDEEQINSIVLGSKKAGIIPKILIPQVENSDELDIVRSIAGDDCEVGAMIESVKTSRKAYAIALESDFIAFGTNDLTADFYDVMRDSIEVSDNKHFASISDEVAEVMKSAVYEIHEAKPDIEIGVCGRHADDDKSVNIFTEMGIDYVSATSSQVPVIKFAISKNSVQEENEVKKTKVKKRRK